MMTPVATVIVTATEAVVAMGIAMANDSGMAAKTAAATAIAGGEIQQSTKKVTTETEIVTEMGMETVMNSVDARTNNSASMTGTRMTCPGCTLRWLRWQPYLWWGGERDGDDRGGSNGSSRSGG